MSAEIHKIGKDGRSEEDLRILQPTEKTTLETPAGTIEVIGTEESFEIGRPGLDKPEMRYSKGDILTIRYQDGKTTKVVAIPQIRLEEQAMLDPMV